MKHLYQRFVLFVTIIVMLITSSVVAHADSSALTWKEWNEYYCNSNQAIDKFFDYYCKFFYNMVYLIVCR